VERLEDRLTPAAVVAVTNALDTVNGDTSSIAALQRSPGGDGISLREAIQAANNTPGANTITFATLLGGQTIHLLGRRPLPTITGNLTIQGQGRGANPVTIDARSPDNLGSRHFEIASRAEVVLSGLRLINGYTADPAGGSIFNNGGKLTVTDCTFSNNSTTQGWRDYSHIDPGRGAAIYNLQGTLDVRNCTLSHNFVRGFGEGAISNERGVVTVTNCTVLYNRTPGISNESGTLTVTGCTVSNNYFEGIGNVRGTLTVTGCTVSANSGTGISTSGTGMVTNCIISNNSGCGIDNSGGPLTVINCTISNNKSTQSGGGIRNTGGTLSVSGSYLSGNSAPEGGGIFHDSPYALTVTNSTIANNTASGNGGGIAYSGLFSLLGRMTVTSSTISGNSAGRHGGGIYNFGSLAVVNSTIVLNRADQDGDGTGSGGGIMTFSVFLVGGTTQLGNSIVAGNLRGAGAGSPDDLAGRAVQPGSSFNLIGDPGSAGGLSHGSNGNLVGDGQGHLLPLASIVSPVLANNGGPTPTHALVPGSPAIDAGPRFSFSVLTGQRDQRGAPFARVAGLRQDIGAYERQAVNLPLVVSTLADESDGDYSPGHLSLREAIGLANGSPGPHTITFAPTLAGTITLGSQELDITDALAILGPGANRITIDAGRRSRIFHVRDGNGGSRFSVTLSGLALANGKATGPFTDGGALRVDGEDLVLRDLLVRNSSAAHGGGVGVDGGGTLAVQRCTLAGNAASYNGGAINLDTGSRLALDSSLLTGNHADALGGALIVFNSQALITSSTFAGNYAGDKGGAIQVWLSPTTVMNSTFSGNTAAWGGAIRVAAVGGTLLLANSTVANNRATNQGGGLSQGGGTVTVVSSLLATNRSSAGADDLLREGGTLNVAFSLVQGIRSATAPAINGTNAQNLIGMDPRLGPLANNGGPTPTHALLAGSPAINRGINPLGLPADQRGRPRVVNGAADIGAFEFGV
jgi:hypothetical protein